MGTPLTAQWLTSYQRPLPWRSPGVIATSEGNFMMQSNQKKSKKIQIIKVVSVDASKNPVTTSKGCINILFQFSPQ